MGFTGEMRGIMPPLPPTGEVARPLYQVIADAQTSLGRIRQDFVDAGIDVRSKPKDILQGAIGNRQLIVEKITPALSELMGREDSNFFISFSSPSIDIDNPRSGLAISRNGLRVWKDWLFSPEDGETLTDDVLRQMAKSDDAMVRILGNKSIDQLIGFVSDRVRILPNRPLRELIRAAFEASLLNTY